MVEAILAASIVLTLTSIAIPMYRGVQDRAQNTQAMADVKLLESEILAYLAVNRMLPVDLAAIGRAGFQDPWGRTYHYLPFALPTAPESGLGQGGGGGGGGGGDGGNAPGQARKDRFLVPVNSDFDLFSAGKDGLWTPAFTAAESKDDVVRAGNGGFIGLAADF